MKKVSKFTLIICCLGLFEVTINFIFSYINKPTPTDGVYSINFVYGNDTKNYSGLLSDEIISEQIRFVINSQIKSFKDLDFEKAYSYASPSIKFFFPNSNSFSKMVKKDYPMIWAPRSYKFLKLRIRNGLLFQEMNFLGPSGIEYTFDYHMRQVDEAWMINGVYLVSKKNLP